MPLQELQALDNRKKEYAGYRKLEILVDSGAAASVLPEGLMSDYPVTKGEAAKKGVHYLTADGGRVPNLGETTLHLVTKEQIKCSVKFQVAEIQTPILYVGTLAAMGNSVAFTKFGGTITNLRTKKKIAFKKRGGVYVLEVLVAPGGLGAGSGRPASAGSPAGTRLASASGSPTPLPGFTRQGNP